MNLFDYIKWQSTDISSREELAALPDGLIFRYLYNVASIQPNTEVTHDFRVRVYDYLVLYYGYDTYKKEFQQALTDYYKANHELV